MNSTITASPPVPAYGRATASLLFSFRYPSAHVPSTPTAAVRNAGSKQSVRFHSSFPLPACLLTRHAYRASFCLLLNWSFLECPCSVLCSILFYYSILPFALFRNLLLSRSTVFFSLYLSLSLTHTHTHARYNVAGINLRHHASVHVDAARKSCPAVFPSFILRNRTRLNCPARIHALLICTAAHTQMDEKAVVFETKTKHGANIFIHRVSSLEDTALKQYRTRSRTQVRVREL